MFLTTKNGEIKIKLNSVITIQGVPVVCNGSKVIKIRGYTTGDIFGSVVVALENRDIDTQTQVTGKIVRFQGIRPVVQFGEEYEVTLNNPREDILKVIQI